MICKIGALRGCGSDDHFIDELLETFERITCSYPLFPVITHCYPVLPCGYLQ